MGRADSEVSHLLKLLAPYIGIGAGLLWLHSAWAGILIYHAQMLAWNWRRFPELARGWSVPALLLVVLPALAVGPGVWFLLPIALRDPGALDVWLGANGLTGASFALMVPYFALVNAAIEEVHWSGLRGADARGWIGHLAFTGYHGLVLWPAIRPGWVFATLALLLFASFVWDQTGRRARGLLIPTLSHLIADAGIVVVAYLVHTMP